MLTRTRTANQRPGTSKTRSEVLPTKKTRSSIRSRNEHNPSLAKKKHGDSDSDTEEERPTSKASDEDFDYSHFSNQTTGEDDKENQLRSSFPRAAKLNTTPTRSTRQNNSSKAEKETPKHNTTPRRSTRNLKNHVEPVEDPNEYSDELGDSDIDILTQKTNQISIVTPLKKQSQSPKKTKISKMHLKISKTPGGSRRCIQVFPESTENNETSIEMVNRPPIKLKIPSTVIDQMKLLSCRLHLSEVPQVLPCREAEAKDIRSFINEAIHPEYGESSAIYIGGVPGTGKTATVRSVVEAMQKERKTPNFVYVEVNAMIFRKKVFVEIYNGIQEKYTIAKGRTKGPTNGKIAPTTARQRLNTIFRKADPNRPSIVILIDELDGLCNRKQDVLYDIFDWTAMPEARVTIIAISNTLDLPERMLNQRIMSRLDKRRLIFQPYDHEQISTIIRARLKDSKMIDENAILLVSRKVAAISGDLRQALDMLRRSIKVAIDKKADKLSMEHVGIAQKAVTEPLKLRLLKAMKLHKFVLFRSVLTVLQETTLEETFFAECYKMYCTLCQSLYGVAAVPGADAYVMMLQLGRCSLVVLSGANIGMMRRKVKLGMTMSEAEKCVKEVDEARKIDS